jgi:hypothetical protein
VIFLKRAKDSANLEQMVGVVKAPDLPEYVVNDKADIRQQMGVLMSVPGDQTGADLAGDDPTLGQALLKKSASNGRMDMFVRAIDRWMYLYFNFLAQMMFVWYTEDHFFPYLDSDGSFERLIIKRYYFDEGMQASVESGSMIAFDKNREQAMALHLDEKASISKLDLYRILGFKNAQRMYDNWVKQQRNPYELARDANDAFDSSEAYAEFLDFMNGKEPKEKMNADKDYILTLRKLMINEKFLTAKAEYRNKFIVRINKYLESYELRKSLDQLGQVDMTKTAPGQPVPPPMPDQQFNQLINPAPPMMPGMGQPGTPPMTGQPPMPPQPPGGSQPGIFNGTPIVNPARPQTPNGIASVPSI